jgi:hypothetical protein
VSERRPRAARRRAQLLTIVALVGGLVGGCRCRQETLAPVVFGDGDRTPIDPNSVLAPPWEPPLVAILDNGAMLHWLHEPQNPAFHVRVLLPTSLDADKLGAAAIAVAIEALELRLAGRLRRFGDAESDIRSRPGRVEIALHGRDSDAGALLEVLAETLADAGDPKLLAVAQGKVLARHREAEASAVAAAGLVSELLGHGVEHEYASKQDLVDLNKNRLERSWSLLTNPRNALVVVHSGSELEDEAMRAAITRLGSRWKAPFGLGGAGFGANKVVTTRLRKEPPKKAPDTYLLTETKAAPMRMFRGHPERGNRAVVMLGRLIPTATPEQRTLARISQRLMQEEFDVRLLVAGPVALLAVRVRVSSSDPVRSLEHIIERMQAFTTEAQPRNRIEQAANLWLGARVVEASLAGEDWTSLWSESIDLAGEDREIFSAIASDAQTMLELEPEQVREFMAQWFDPQGGEPGWVWVAAGIDANFEGKLGARIRLFE